MSTPTSIIGVAIRTSIFFSRTSSIIFCLSYSGIKPWRRPTFKSENAPSFKRWYSVVAAEADILSDGSIKGQTINTINKNFFQISDEMYQLQKTNIEQGQPAIQGISNQAAAARAAEGSSNQSRFASAAISPDIQETSISRMITLMKKYYIPPELDFLTYSNKAPFVMYIFEFNHTFNQQDLADIWQGVLPKIGTEAQRSDSKDDNEIIHDFGPYDFFEGRRLPNNIRWLTFKVKQKGEKNYYSLTADSRDDNRFKFNFNVGKQTPDYSYNWPYDFFSLIELIKITGGINIK